MSIQVYDIILSEAELKEAIQLVVGGVVDESGISTQNKPRFSNYIETVENVEIYYDYGADYYYFTPKNLN